MYARIRRLTSGTASAQDITDRLVSDVLPIYEASVGYVSYSVIGVYTNGVITFRVFDDLETLETATAAAGGVQQQIGIDLGIDADDENLEGDVLVDDRPLS